MNGFENDIDAMLEARSKHQAVYLKGLQECGVALLPDGVDVAFVRKFFADRIAELDAGTVLAYDYPIWKTIGYVLTFKMEFPYWFVDAEPGKVSDPKRDICGSTDFLPAHEDQMAIATSLKDYLVAAAALAQRLCSSTYEGWRDLLVEVEFGGRRGIEIFPKSGSYDKFYGKLIDLVRLLWADSKIAAHQTSAQMPPTHTHKQAKNARGEGGGHVQCAIWKGRGGQGKI